jgi:hypothetical protein
VLLRYSFFSSCFRKEKNQGEGPLLEEDTTLWKEDGFKARIGICTDLFREIEASFFF